MQSAGLGLIRSASARVAALTGQPRGGPSVALPRRLLGGTERFADLRPGVIQVAVRVPINYPCRSRRERRVVVFVEGSAESVSSADFQVGELGLLGNGCG